ncbi:MAG TPA: class I SAM-dependent methyltransferase [Candidatus Dormibacteraeota bacterium]
MAPRSAMLFVVSGNQELLSAVRSARRKLVEIGPARTRAEGDFERVALPDEDCDVLRDLLLAEQARVIVEIGLAYGRSALAIAEALAAQGHPEARHVIVDAFQHHFQDAGWEAIASARLAGLSTLARERSQIALPRLLSQGLVADAAFVDGSHIFHNVFVDLYFLREIVRPGGLLVLDDYQWPSVATAVRYFELNTGWRPVPIGRPTRLRAFQLPDPRVEPAFEDFKPFQPA